MSTTKNIQYPLVALLCCYAIQWVDFSGLPISQWAFAAPLLLVVLAMQVRFPIGSEASLYKIYATFPLALIFALPYSQDLAAGFVATVRTTAYLVLSFVFYSWLRSLPEARVVKTLSQAIFYVAPAFLVVFLISAQTAGVNIIQETITAVSNGNPNWLQFRIFAVVLNNGDIEAGGYSSAARHGIMLSLMTVVFLHLYLRTRPSIVGTALCFFLIFFVFFSLSRSAILGLVLAYLCLVIKKVATGEFSYVKLLFAVGVTVPFLSLSGVLESGGLQTLLSTQFIEDIANNPRIFEFFQIVDRIDENAWLGWGTGTHLNLFGLEAQYPHNFILYAWHQTGLLGLISSGLFTIFIIYSLVVSVQKAAKLSKSDRRRSNAFLLAASLLSLVLVRLMFAKAGLLAVPEWTAFALAVYGLRLGTKGFDQIEDVRLPSTVQAQAASHT